MSSRLRRGLYAITPESLSGQALHDAVRAVLGGRAVALQYRDKSDDTSRRLADAHALRALCTAAGALLIINDDPGLAVACDADGVHLGRDDASVEAARAVVGAERLIGVSCYDSLDAAREATAQGANYVAFGSLYPSATKPGATRAPLALISEARRALRVPVVAIGGITPDNGAAVIDAGAHLIAAVGGVFDSDNPRAAARAYTKLFRKQKA